MRFLLLSRPHRLAKCVDELIRLRGGSLDKGVDSDDSWAKYIKHDHALKLVNIMKDIHIALPCSNSASSKYILVYTNCNMSLLLTLSARAASISSTLVLIYIV